MYIILYGNILECFSVINVYLRYGKRILPAYLDSSVPVISRYGTKVLHIADYFLLRECPLFMAGGQWNSENCSYSKPPQQSWTTSTIPLKCCLPSVGLASVLNGEIPVKACQDYHCLFSYHICSDIHTAKMTDPSVSTWITAISVHPYLDVTCPWLEFITPKYSKPDLCFLHYDFTNSCAERGGQNCKDN